MFIKTVVKITDSESNTVAQKKFLFKFQIYIITCRQQTYNLNKLNTYP